MESRNEKQGQSQNQDASLLSLDNNIKRYLCTFLDGKSLSHLKQTSKDWASIISDDTSKVENGKTFKKIYIERLNNDLFWESDPFRNLLSHGDLGELEDAEKIWKAHPDLLTRRGTVYHPNRIYVEGEDPIDIPFNQNPGRYKYSNRTFYQILLMNSEFEEAEEVGKLMTQEEKQKQFDEVFPDGEIKKYNFDLGEAKKLLQALFDTVAKDESIKIERDTDYNIKNIIMSDSTQKALHALYLYAKPKAEHKIGLVFDPEFYHKALKLYDEKYDQFNQKWDRYTFWNICAEEWLAGCLGTGYLRPHSQGFDNPTTRRGCLLADGSSYFPFRDPSIPGYHFFVGYYGDRRVAGMEWLEAWDSVVSFRNLCRAKTRARTDFMRQFARPETGSCLIS